jgi:hypothetical protein
VPYDVRPEKEDSVSVREGLGRLATSAMVGFSSLKVRSSDERVSCRDGMTSAVDGVAVEAVWLEGKCVEDTGYGAVI